jgi:hypothetical protein
MTLIPVTHVALEIGADADQLADQLAAQTLTDDIGRVCLDKDTARRVIADHQAAQAAAAAAQHEREEAFHDEMARLNAEYNPRARVAAIGAYQDRLKAEGLLAEGTPPLAVLAGADHQDRMDRSGRRLEQFMRGESSGYLINPTTRRK